METGGLAAACVNTALGFFNNWEAAVKCIDKPGFVSVIRDRASQDRPMLPKTRTEFLL